VTGTGGVGGPGGRDREGRWLAAPTTPAQAQLRQALDQAAAREADEVALRRVWARLSDLPTLGPPVADDGDNARIPPLSRRPRWPWIALASMAGATAALAFMLVETQSGVRVENRRRAEASQNQASANKNDNKTDGLADQGSTLVAPATVRTGFGETLHLALRGGTQVVVTSESALALDEQDRPRVSSGEVQFHVPRQAPGHTFAVAAGTYRVVVVGTRFSVRVNQQNAAVGVNEGVVEIWTDHRIARVAAGESWVSPASSTAVTPFDSSTPKATPKATPKTTPSRPARSVQSPTVATPGTVGARVTNDVRPKEMRLALASPSVSSRSVTTANSAPASVGNNDSASPAVADVASTAAPAPPAVSAVESTPLLVQARAARAAGDSRRALGLYRTLALRGGAAGENAEYEIGRVLRDGLHQPREAVSAWRTYKTQHPRGMLRVEADISVIETLVALGDKNAAVTEATEFLGRYPESERRMEIARLAGDLLRERGDCSGAVNAYNVALVGGRSRKLEERRDIADGVSFHRAACLLRGDRNEGVGALKAYLRSFPTGRFRTDAQRLMSDAPSTAAVRP
jgi:ferric-dicitrate binding protein FerR (iron transport regulator)